MQIQELEKRLAEQGRQIQEIAVMLMIIANELPHAKNCPGGSDACHCGKLQLQRRIHDATTKFL